MLQQSFLTSVSFTACSCGRTVHAVVYIVQHLAAGVVQLQCMQIPVSCLSVAHSLQAISAYSAACVQRTERSLCEM